MQLRDISMKIKLSNKQMYSILIWITVTTIIVFGVYKLVEGDQEEQPIQTEGMLNLIIMVGVLFGIIKFASKVSLGCSFSHMNRIETATVATIYFCIPLIISLIIDIAGSALGSIMTNIVDFNVILGISQAVISILLLAVGIYTVKKWTTSKKNVSKKTSLFMVFPCPGTLITMFTTAAILIISGMKSYIVGFLIGGIFVLFIVVGGFIVKKAKIRRNPTSFGGVMIFFSILYIFSALFIPAYIPVSQMDISIEAAPLFDVLPALLVMCFAVVFGYFFSIYTKRIRG
jgi:predicted transporter